MTNYPEAEREAGHILSPFTPGETAIHINRVGVIQKGIQESGG